MLYFLKISLIVFLIAVGYSISHINHTEIPNFNKRTLEEIRDRLKAAICLLEETNALDRFVRETNKGLEKKITSKKSLFNYMLQEILEGKVEYGEYFNPIIVFGDRADGGWEKDYRIKFPQYYHYYKNNKI